MNSTGIENLDRRFIREFYDLRKVKFKHKNEPYLGIYLTYLVREFVMLFEKLFGFLYTIDCLIAGAMSFPFGHLVQILFEETIYIIKLRIMI